MRGTPQLNVVPLLIAALLLGGSLAGCSDPVAVKRGPCGEDLSSKPQLGGPLETATGGLKVGLNREYAPMDVGIIYLEIPVDQEVTVDSVQLEPEVGVVVLDATFVVEDSHGSTSIRPSGKYPAKLIPLHCYRVQHHPSRHAPNLVFRVRPMSAGLARNKTVDIIYHTPDGQRYVSVWLYQMEFAPRGKG